MSEQGGFALKKRKQIAGAVTWHLDEDLFATIEDFDHLSEAEIFKDDKAAWGQFTHGQHS
jgi:hypothetical protein